MGNNNIKVHSRLWITQQNHNFLGRGKIELLERIAKSGSISKAAKEMKMSYKAAWDSIDCMNNLSLTPLVISSNGGKGGGGSIVTKEGLEAIRLFREIEVAQRKFLETFNANLNKTDRPLHIHNEIENFPISTSASNEITATIVQIESAPIISTITLNLFDTEKIISQISTKSLEKLELTHLQNCLALINANCIEVLLEREDTRENAQKNFLRVTIDALQKNDGFCEITATFKQHTLYAIISAQLANTLDLRENQEVWFSFRANDVILAI